MSSPDPTFYPRDLLNRPLASLRLSVTDRCNLRCSYCMPEESYTWLRRQMLLTFEELTRLTRILTRLGVDRVRLTGGEPLLRRDLPHLIERLKGLELREIALTTNGTLLAKQQEALFQAGLDRVTVSLDAACPEVFRHMSQRNDFEAVLAGLRSVAQRPGLKIDSVIVAGSNEQQILPLLQLGTELGAEVRFIEYMDVGGATRWRAEKVFSQSQILQLISTAHGQVRPLQGRGSAPAGRFVTESGLTFGVIASVTQPFCRACDRARVTADGQLLTCLYAKKGKDLRSLLRSGQSDGAIETELRQIWQRRTDRGAELRQELKRRGPLADVAELQENPHLEMHTRGG